MPSTPDRFGVLFKRSWIAFKEYRQPIIVGAALVAAVSVIASLLTGDTERLVQPTVQELLTLIGIMLLSGLVSYCGQLYLLAVAIEGKKTPGEAMSRIAPLFFPFIGVSIWAFIMSYGWIILIAVVIASLPSDRDILSIVGWVVGIIGFIIGAYRIVRLSLAPYIMISEGKGIRESVRESWYRTRGYWWKLFGNGILLFLCLLPITLLGMLISFLVGVGAGLGSVASGAQNVPESVLQIAGAGAGFLYTWLTLLTTGFSLFFWRFMTETITKSAKR
jgi:hypothetical protein